jgi:hypothetical protein
LWAAAKFRSNLREVAERRAKRSTRAKMGMIDEGGGRYTPCEALVKPKKAKKKG